MIFAASIGANQQPLNLPPIQYSGLFPELTIAIAALLLLLFSSMVRDRLHSMLCATITALTGAVSLAFVVFLWHRVKLHGSYTIFNGALAVDHFSLFVTTVIGIALILSALVASDWLTERNQHGPEFFVLMMISAVGAEIMGAANDLISIFLGLEVLSIALYVLVGSDRRAESKEGAIKYFILGGFSSAIFLYGIALTYGATGSTNLTNIATFLSTNTLLDYGLLLAGMSLLAVGFAFKIAAVPFHQWTPDVYQGAPTPVTAYMAAAAKAGAFAALLRVFASTFYSMKLDWQPMILAVTLLTLLVGSIAACVQMNVKRMLAYSSISHAGFILLGLQAATVEGIAGSLYYLLAYTFMSIGSFAIVAIVGGQDDSKKGLEAFRGLGRRQPLFAFAFAVLLLAQAGVPLTSGFLAKFYVISAQVNNGSYATAVFAMVIAAVAAFFYLRIIVAMYSADEKDTDSVSVGESLALTSGDYFEVPVATQLVLYVAVAITLIMGVVPGGQHSGDWVPNAVQFAQQSAADFFSS